MFKNKYVETKLKGNSVKVYAISTGSVSVKTKFKETSRTGFLSKLDFIFDKTFTEWLPIWVWVIEHPEGIFLIDLGENSNINNSNYYKSSGYIANWFNKSMFKFRVNRNQEIDKQLKKIDIDPKNIKNIVLTHLHIDHIDGIRHFPNTEIIVNKVEWKKPYGNLPKLYPKWFKPKLIELNKKYQDFDASYLTKSRDLIAVHTPGHTYGHTSVILKTDDYDIMFAGDICFSQNQLIYEKFSGSNVSRRYAKNTYRKIISYSKTSKLIFLPSHDREAGERLKKLKPLNT